MKKFRKSEKTAFVGTLVSIFLLFLLLLFVFLPGLKPEEEGLMVSFGEFEDGAGSENATEASQNLPQSSPKANDDILTQDEPSVVVNKKKESVKKDVLVETKNITAEEERLRKEKEAIEKANQLDGAFGNQNSGGQGTGSGDEKKGNPAGQGTQDGNSWSLSGRDISGSLVSPAYDRNQEGIVTVQIRVDENGSVVGATIGKPTTISDVVLRNAALSAARRTRFSKGNSVSKGSIIYNFKFR